MIELPSLHTGASSEHSLRRHPKIGSICLQATLVLAIGGWSIAACAASPLAGELKSGGGAPQAAEASSGGREDPNAPNPASAIDPPPMDAYRWPGV